MKKHLLILSILILLISSTLVPISLGSNKSNSNEQLIIEDFNFDRHLYPEYYNCNNNDVTSNFIKYQNYDVSTNHGGNVAKESNPGKTIQPLDSPMDSPWPMYCHDTRHTGRSPFSTADNSFEEKWRYKLSGVVYHGASAIDNEGVIYLGRRDLYAIYPNGTLKWIFDTDGWNGGICPAIDENGTIYYGTICSGERYLYAINPDGSQKWKVAHSDMCSSPVIANDGTIIYADSNNWMIEALYPNGTLKWTYKANHVIYSSPAIAFDGTIYFGSHDNYVYALYPNGTLRWKYNTGSWVHGSPTIAEDGTMYMGSDNGKLYAFYPNNGTVKWQRNIGAIWASPALDENGNIYVGVFQQKFYAIYPNGTVKWTYDAPGRIWFGSSAAISTEGTIYFGTTEMDGGSGVFIALNPDGTERFKDTYGLYGTSPVIGSDGTVYACSSHYEQGEDFVYLRAFGNLDSNAPSAPDIDGPLNGTVGKDYDYTFKSTSPLGRDVYYYIVWGGGSVKDWFGPFSSGEEVTISHKWSSEGTYTIKARAKDTDNLWGPWGSLEVTMPRDKATNNILFLGLLERFPLLWRVVSRLNVR